MVVSDVGTAQVFNERSVKYSASAMTSPGCPAFIVVSPNESTPVMTMSMSALLHSQICEGIADGAKSFFPRYANADNKVISIAGGVLARDLLTLGCCENDPTAKRYDDETRNEYREPEVSAGNVPATMSHEGLRDKA